MRESAALVNTTSFSTTRESTCCPLRYASASSIARSSNVAVPSSTRSSDGSSSSMRISVRNPRLPKFTPRIGMSRLACAMRAAIASSVPSPPSTTTRSTSRGSASRVSVFCALARPRRPAPPSRVRTPASTPRSRSHGAEPRHVLGCGDEALLGDDADAADAHGRRWRRNSTLPFCPVIGEGVDAAWRQSYRSGCDADLLDDARVNGRIVNHALAHLARGRLRTAA